MSKQGGRCLLRPVRDDQSEQTGYFQVGNQKCMKLQMHSFMFLCILICQMATRRRRAVSSRSRWHPSWSTTPLRRLVASSQTPSSPLSPLGRSALTFTCSAKTTRALASLSWLRRPSPRLEVRNKTQLVHKNLTKVQLNHQKTAEFPSHQTWI